MSAGWYEDLADHYGLPPDDGWRIRQRNADQLRLGAALGGIDDTAVIGRVAQDRRHLAEHGQTPERWLRPKIHETARIGALTVIDAGTVRPTMIGEYCWLMCQVHVGHDCKLGARVEIAPNTTLCGHVEIGDDVRIGCNVAILPYRKIGAGARVGAGSVVTHDVPAGETWAGNPARRLAHATRAAAA